MGIDLDEYRNGLFIRRISGAQFPSGGFIRFGQGVVLNGASLPAPFSQGQSAFWCHVDIFGGI
jgi:hypothetical protein